MSRFGARFVLLVALASGCSDSSPAARVDPVGRSTPEAQGIDALRLRLLVADLASRDLGLHSLMVMRHGNIVLDALFFPYDGKRPHDIASCTKSLTSTAIGSLLRSGELKSLDQTLLSFFPERTIANDSADKRAITLANALSMTSGFDCVAQPELTLTQMQSAPDWIGFALDVPMAGPPGQSFRYCSTVPHLLSGVVSRSSGKPLDQLLTERLFEPLLAEPPVWPRDPQGISHGWGDARLKPEAMARFGQMLLGGGKFGDTRVLDKSYVDLATTNRDGTLLPPPGYGYGIWIGGSGSFYANGRGGQQVIVVPFLDLVVVTTAAESPEQEQALMQRLNGELARGLSDTPLEPNPVADSDLADTLAQVASAPSPVPIPPAPPTASTVSGVRYHLGSNILGWDSIALTFSNGEASLSASMGSSTLTAPIGLDAVPRITRGVRFATPERYADIDVAMTGRWLDASTFEVTFDTIDTIEAGTLRFTFDGTGTQIALHERTVGSDISFQGTPQ